MKNVGHPPLLMGQEPGACGNKDLGLFPAVGRLLLVVAIGIFWYLPSDLYCRFPPCSAVQQ